MIDDPTISSCETLANVIIAEIKRDACHLNGPWTNEDQQNIQRVLHAIGCIENEVIQDAAANLYADGFWSGEQATIRLFAIGEQKDPSLMVAAAQQIEWTQIIHFCVERLRAYRRQKSSNRQWDEDGRRLYVLAQDSDIAGIRNYFQLRQGAPNL